MGLERHLFEVTLVLRGPRVNLISKNKNENPYKSFDGAMLKARNRLSKLKEKKLSISRRKRIA